MRCAYFAPVDTLVSRDENCKITGAGGEPIDSSVVYLYASGSISITSGNCKTTSGVDIFSGNTFTHEYCDEKGTFNITLKNSAGNSIVITNGRLEKYHHFVR